MGAGPSQPVLLDTGKPTVFEARDVPVAEKSLTDLASLQKKKRRRVFNAKVTTTAAYEAAGFYIFLHDKIGGIGAFASAAGVVASAIASPLKDVVLGNAKFDASAFASKVRKPIIMFPLCVVGCCWLLDWHSNWYDKHKRLLETGNAFNVLSEFAEVTEDEQMYLTLRKEIMWRSTGHIPDRFHKKAMYEVLVKMLEKDHDLSKQEVSDLKKQFPLKTVWVWSLWRLPRDWETTLKTKLKLT